MTRKSYLQRRRAVQKVIATRAGDAGRGLQRFTQGLSTGLPTVPGDISKSLIGKVFSICLEKHQRPQRAGCGARRHCSPMHAQLHPQLLWTTAYRRHRDACQAAQDGLRQAVPRSSPEVLAMSTRQLLHSLLAHYACACSGQAPDSR